MERAVFDASPDAIVVLDLRSCIREWNRAAERTFGYTAEEVLGRDIADFIIPPEQGLRQREGMARFVASGMTAIIGERFELEALRRDGSLFPTEISLCAVETGGERVFVSFIRDISDRKQEKRRFDEALLAGRMVTWDWDVRSGYVHRSENATEVLGLPSGPARDFFHRVHAEDRAALSLQQVGEPAATETFEAEVRFQKPTGEWIWIKERGTAYRDENGTVSRIVGVVSDVTHRKTSELREQHQAAVLEATLNNMDQGIIMFDAADRVQVRNDRALELLNLPAELLQGSSTFKAIREYQLATGEFATSDDNFRRWVATTGVAPERHVYERVRPDGTVLEIRTVPLPGGGAVRTYTDVTARRRAEEEVLRREERFRALALAGGSVVWRAAPDGAIIERQGSEVALENEPDNFAGFSWVDNIHEADRNRVINAWTQAVASGEPATVPEFRVARADGDYRWFTARAVPLKKTDGSVREWIGTVTDVHEEKSARDELEKSEERLRLASEATDLGIYDIDLRTGRREWSPKLRAILGISDHARVGREVLAGLIHPDDRERIVTAFDDSIACPSGRLEDVFRIVRGCEGEVRWVSTFGVTLADAAGRPVRAIGTLRDVTAREGAEAARKESEAKYRLLAENSTDLIVRTGADGTCKYASPASYDVLGYKPDELVGTRLLTITHPEDEPSVRAGLQDLLARRAHHVTATFRAQRKDGQWVWLESRRRVLDTSSGEALEILSVVRDISERIKLEERLRHAQKMEAIGQLTGGVAHDFNNLLTVIQGNAEILVEDLPSDPAVVATLSQEILSAAERGADLNSKLLAFGRRQSLKPVALPLAEVTSRVGGLLKRTLGEQIELKIESSVTTASALVDKALLESAILNLAVNARDAMPSGGSLEIRTGERVATHKDGAIPVGQTVVYLTVTDTGTGIAPDVLEHVFEPFFTTKEVGKGTGLGLAMVYGYIQQSAGHVSIESEVGRGTSVSLIFPAIKVGKEEVAAERQETVPRGKGENVLLVEDDPAVRHYVCSQLVGLGYRVEAVGAAPDALDLLKGSRKFHLLLTDVVLPKGMSGVELATRAREIDLKLKIVLTSGYPEEVFRHQGRPHMRLLPKPFRRKDLAQILRTVLDQEGTEVLRGMRHED